MGAATDGVLGLLVAESRLQEEAARRESPAFAGGCFGPFLAVEHLVPHAIKHACSPLFLLQMLLAMDIQL